MLTACRIAEFKVCSLFPIILIYLEMERFLMADLTHYEVPIELMINLTFTCLPPNSSVYSNSYNQIIRCNCSAYTENRLLFASSEKQTNYNNATLSFSVKCRIPQTHVIYKDLPILSQLNFEGIPNYRNIKELDLSENGFVEVRGKPFLNFNNLKKLILRDNLIYDIDLGAFEGLFSLTKLDLSYNRLYLLNRGTFTHLPKLQRLNLAGNSMIKRIPNNAFDTLPSLKWINLPRIRCDCNVKWIVEWIARNQIKVSDKSICDSMPVNLTNHPIKYLKKKELHCNWPVELSQFTLEPHENQLIFEGDHIRLKCTVKDKLPFTIQPRLSLTYQRIFHSKRQVPGETHKNSSFSNISLFNTNATIYHNQWPPNIYEILERIIRAYGINDILKIEWLFDDIPLLFLPGANGGKINRTTRIAVSVYDSNFEALTPSNNNQNSIDWKIREKSRSHLFPTVMITIESEISLSTGNLSRYDIMDKMKNTEELNGGNGKGQDPSANWTCKAMKNVEYDLVFQHLIQQTLLRILNHDNGDVEFESTVVNLNKSLQELQEESSINQTLSIHARRNLTIDLLDKKLAFYLVERNNSNSDGKIDKKSYQLKWKNASKSVQIDIVSTNFTKYCPQNLQVDAKGSFLWPRSIRNTLITVDCYTGVIRLPKNDTTSPRGPEEMTNKSISYEEDIRKSATRYCRWNGTWSSPQTSECPFKSSLTQKLFQLGQISFEEIGNRVEALKKITKYLPEIVEESANVWPDSSFSDQNGDGNLNLIFVVKVLERLIEFIVISKSERGALITLRLLDTIMNIPLKMPYGTNSQGLANNTSNRIILLVDKLTRVLSSERGDKIVTSKNFVFQNILVDLRNFKGLTCVFYDHVTNFATIPRDSKSDLSASSSTPSVKCVASSSINPILLRRDKNVKTVLTIPKGSLKKPESCNSRSQQGGVVSAFTRLFIHERAGLKKYFDKLNTPKKDNSCTRALGITYYRNIQLFRHLKLKANDIVIVSKNTLRDGSDQSKQQRYRNEFSEFLPTLTSPVLNVQLDGQYLAEGIIIFKCAGPSLFDKPVDWNPYENGVNNQFWDTNRCRLASYYESYCTIMCQEISFTGLMQDATLLMYEKTYKANSKSLANLRDQYYEVYTRPDQRRSSVLGGPGQYSVFDEFAHLSQGTEKSGYNIMPGATTKTYVIRINGYERYNERLRLPWYMYAGGCLLFLTLMVLSIIYIIFSSFLLINRGLRHCLINQWMCSSVLLFIYLFGLRVLAGNDGAIIGGTTSSHYSQPNSSSNICKFLGFLIHYFSLTVLVWIFLISKSIYVTLRAAIIPSSSLKLAGEQSNNWISLGDSDASERRRHSLVFNNNSNYGPKITCPSRQHHYKDLNATNTATSNSLNSLKFHEFAGYYCRNARASATSRRIRLNKNQHQTHQTNHHLHTLKCYLPHPSIHKIAEEAPFTTPPPSSNNNSLLTVGPAKSSTFGAAQDYLNNTSLQTPYPITMAGLLPSHQSSVVNLYLVGYGVSSLICGVTASISMDNYYSYKHLGFCFIVWESSVWAFYVPCVLILFMNGLYLMTCIYVYRRKNSRWRLPMKKSAREHRNPGFCHDESFLMYQHHQRGQQQQLLYREEDDDGCCCESEISNHLFYRRPLTTMNRLNDKTNGSYFKYDDRETGCCMETTERIPEDDECESSEDGGVLLPSKNYGCTKKPSRRLGYDVLQRNRRWPPPQRIVSSSPPTYVFSRGIRGDHLNRNNAPNDNFSSKQQRLVAAADPQLTSLFNRPYKDRCWQLRDADVGYGFNGMQQQQQLLIQKKKQKRKQLTTTKVQHMTAKKKQTIVINQRQFYGRNRSLGLGRGRTFHHHEDSSTFYRNHKRQMRRRHLDGSYLPFRQHDGCGEQWIERTEKMGKLITSIAAAAASGSERGINSKQRHRPGKKIITALDDNLLSKSTNKKRASCLITSTTTGGEDLSLVGGSTTNASYINPNNVWSSSSSPPNSSSGIYGDFPFITTPTAATATNKLRCCGGDGIKSLGNLIRFHIVSTVAFMLLWYMGAIYLVGKVPVARKGSKFNNNHLPTTNYETFIVTDNQGGGSGDSGAAQKIQLTISSSSTHFFNGQGGSSILSSTTGNPPQLFMVRPHHQANAQSAASPYSSTSSFSKWADEGLPNDSKGVLDQLIRSIGGENNLDSISISITFGGTGLKNDFSSNGIPREYGTGKTRNYDNDKMMINLQPYHVKYYLDYYAGHFIAGRNFFSHSSTSIERRHSIKYYHHHRGGGFHGSGGNILSSYAFVSISIIIAITLIFYHVLSRPDLMSSLANKFNNSEEHKSFGPMSTDVVESCHHHQEPISDHISPHTNRTEPLNYTDEINDKIRHHHVVETNLNEEKLSTPIKKEDGGIVSSPLMPLAHRHVSLSSRTLSSFKTPVKKGLIMVSRDGPSKLSVSNYVKSKFVARRYTKVNFSKSTNIPLIDLKPAASGATDSKLNLMEESVLGAVVAGYETPFFTSRWNEDKPSSH